MCACFYPPAPRPDAGKLSFTPAYTLRYSCLSTARAPRPRTRTASAHPPRPHACTPLPSSLALRPRHLLVQEVSPHTPDAAAAHSGRAAAARNRAAGSTPAARTPPTHTGCLAAPKRAGVSFPPRRPSPNLGLRASPLSSPLCTLLHPYPTLLSSATTALYPPQTLDLDYRV